MRKKVFNARYIEALESRHEDREFTVEADAIAWALQKVQTGPADRCMCAVFYFPDGHYCAGFLNRGGGSVRVELKHYTRDFPSVHKESVSCKST